jgi:hypothetical protein
LVQRIAPKTLVSLSGDLDLPLEESLRADRPAFATDESCLSQNACNLIPRFDIFKTGPFKELDQRHSQSLSLSFDRIAHSLINFAGGQQL